jgi:hypothetical protein
MGNVKVGSGPGGVYCVRARAVVGVGKSTLDLNGRVFFFFFAGRRVQLVGEVQKGTAERDWVSTLGTRLYGVYTPYRTWMYQERTLLRVRLPNLMHARRYEVQSTRSIHPLRASRTK